MSNFPESIDIFVDKTGSDYVASSDPNNAFEGIETSQGLLGALGLPQSWSTTLLTLLRKYRNGMYPVIEGGVPVVRAGEVMLENTNGTKLASRRNAADVTLGAGNIDSGSVIATTYYIYAKAGTAATTAPILFSTSPVAPSGIGTAPYTKLGWFVNKAAGSVSATFAGSDVGGRIVNVFNAKASVLSTTSVAIPSDDSIPQNDEGAELMSVQAKPSKTTNWLRIQATIYGSPSAPLNIVSCLFKDAGVNAIAVAAAGDSNSGYHVCVTLDHYMQADTVDEITFTLRAGADGAGTVTFNGLGGARKFGGVYVSSMTVTEIEG